jgi:CRISPR type III-A-associated RAMP protein Csm4
MPVYNVIKLKQLTPIHIGTGKENYDFSSSILESDTLLAAIAAIRAMQGKKEDTLNFLESVTISSAFPYWRKSFFLPKMQGKVNIKVNDEDERISRKALKKITYIEKGLWSELSKGQTVFVDKWQIKGQFLIASNDFEEVSRKSVNQRAFVPREEFGKTEPFYFEWNYFHPEAGLYCLIDCKQELFSEIVSLFKLLGINGIGTDKNVGGGKFEVEVDTLSIDEVDDFNYRMILSLYLPDESEMPELNLDDSRFSMSLRGGYIAGSSEEKFRHLKKKSVYMFNVGSLFYSELPLKGKIVDLKPEWNDEQMHPVYRSGKPINLPVKI